MAQKQEQPEWMTIAAAATILRVSGNTVRNYADAGRLDDPHPVTRLPGGHRRLHRDSVERLRRELYGD